MYVTNFHGPALLNRGPVHITEHNSNAFVISQPDPQYTVVVAEPPHVKVTRERGQSEPAYPDAQPSRHMQSPYQAQYP